MVIELINTGTELMLGRTLNTHQQWLCAQLADRGYVVSRQVAIPDTAHDIEETVRGALSRADLVFTTGGLGPTSDDLTRDKIAALLGRKLVADAAVLANIKRFFDIRGRAMPESTGIQALVLDASVVLKNNYGTAPGMAIRVHPNPFRTDGKSSWLIMLPGPPRELRPMFLNAVLPLLAKVLPVEAPFACTTLRTIGIGESIVEERLAPPLQTLVNNGLDLGYCARPGQVDVRLAANGANADSLVKQAEQIVRENMASDIFTDADEELETVVIRLLRQSRKTVAIAESCTGGYIANRLTNIPGASDVLLAGVVSYSNEAKQVFLGVSDALLIEQGAVSEEVARQMAKGIRHKSGADFALSTTGIAGPGGGSTDKPVGTVYIGLSTSESTIAIRQFNPFDRETFKNVVCLQGLDLLRRKLTNSV
jgi:nicotinamide-nucleotide amidase